MLVGTEVPKASVENKREMATWKGDKIKGREFMDIKADVNGGKGVMEGQKKAGQKVFDVALVVQNQQGGGGDRQMQ